MLGKKKEDNRFYPTVPFFDQFFERFFEDDGWSKKNAMLVDLVEKDDKYLVKADLPDYKKDEVSISVRQNQLIIEAAHKDTKEKKKGKTIITERYCGNYHRSINLPGDSIPDKIKASMKKGVLAISIPKSEEKKPKQIQIN
jgi:HSP20 family protein